MPPLAKRYEQEASGRQGPAANHAIVVLLSTNFWGRSGLIFVNVASGRRKVELGQMIGYWLVAALVVIAVVAILVVSVDETEDES